MLTVAVIWLVVFGRAENIILLWHMKEIPSQRVPLWKAEAGVHVDTTHL